MEVSKGCGVDQHLKDEATGSGAQSQLLIVTEPEAAFASLALVWPANERFHSVGSAVAHCIFCSQGCSLTKVLVISLPGITRILEKSFNDEIHVAKQVRCPLKFLESIYSGIKGETLYLIEDARYHILLRVL